MYKHKQIFFNKKIHNQIHPGFLDFAASFVFGKPGLADIFFVATLGGDNFSGFLAGLVTWH